MKVFNLREKHRGFKRLLCVFISVVLLCGLFTSAYAAETDGEPADVPEETTAEEKLPEYPSGPEEAPDTTPAPDGAPEIIPDTIPDTDEISGTPLEAEELPKKDDSKAAPLMMAKSTPEIFAVSAEDVNYIIVEKVFIGLPSDLIPDNFQITVSSNSGASFTLDESNTVSRETDAEGNSIWRWKITGVGTGTYTINESNEEVQDYNVTKSGEGSVTVETADFAVSILEHDTTCNHTNWPVMINGDSNVLFAATLSHGDGVAVISKTPLSASQRDAVSETVLNINGPWKTPVHFYSIEEQMQNGVGFELNGATITYDAANEEINIGATNNWQHVVTLSYSISEASNPEITLVNTYQRNFADVTIRKLVAGDMADKDAGFDFTVTVKTGDTDAAFKLNATEYTGSAAFSLKHGESIVLQDIPIEASVTVSETAADGYFASYAIDDSGEAAGNAAFIQTVENDHVIVFTNRKDSVPDTGVLLDSLPYILILGIVIVGIVIVLVRRRKKHNDD